MVLIILFDYQHCLCIPIFEFYVIHEDKIVNENVAGLLLKPGNGFKLG